MTAGRLSLLYDVHRVSRLTDALIERSLEGHDLNGSEFALYSYLVGSGPVTVSDVADAIAASMATTSKLLARLDERGHLLRQSNPEDGRSILVELNKAGRAAHSVARPSFVASLRRVEDVLGGAVADVRWALVRLDDALRRTLDPAATTRNLEAPAFRTLSYDGAPLTAGEEHETRCYVDWLRWQREHA